MQPLPPSPIQPQNRPPDNNLIWAILSTLMCCMPTGIYAIVKASEVEGKWYAGDFEGAEKSAKEAKDWSIYGAIGAVVIIFLYLFISFIIPFAIFLITALIPLLSSVFN